MQTIIWTNVPNQTIYSALWSFFVEEILIQPFLAVVLNVAWQQMDVLSSSLSQWVTVQVLQLTQMEVPHKYSSQLLFVPRWYCWVGQDFEWPWSLHQGYDAWKSLDQEWYLLCSGKCRENLQRNGVEDSNLGDPKSI